MRRECSEDVWLGYESETIQRANRPKTMATLVDTVQVELRRGLVVVGGDVEVG